MLIRPGRKSDSPAIARVLVDTWRSTFDGLLPAVFLDSMSVEAQLARHESYFSQPDVVYRVVEDSCDGVVGFASAGPDRGAREVGAGELYAIYLREAVQRQGRGRELFLSVVEALADSFVSLRVRVLAVNPCLPFYERLGGRRGESAMLELGAEEFEEISFYWDALSDAMERAR